MTLNQINNAPTDAACTAFLQCCGSSRWAETMAARRPYDSLESMQQVAAEVWTTLRKSDWLQAFAAHPKIGEKKTSAKWSATEQSGMETAREQTAADLHRLNEEYATKFGWIFIVCATGRSADEMLQFLQHRINNDRDSELDIAAAEQLKITNLRLVKLISQ